MTKSRKSKQQRFEDQIDRQLDHLVDDLLEHLDQMEQDLSKCPTCGGPADNGHDRSYPPSPYICTKCERKQRKKDRELRETYRLRGS